MNRLTGRIENNDPYYPHCYESNCDSNCAACDFDYEVLEKLTAYEDLEEKLEKVYGECDGLLETVVNNLIKHEGVEIGKPKKAKLLTDEDIDKWEYLKNAEEQGLLLIVPCKVGDTAWVIDEDFEYSGKKKIYEAKWTRVSLVPVVTKHQFEIRGEVQYQVYDFYYSDGRTMLHGMYVGQYNTKFGEVVFASKEEAEQALARIRMEK